MRRIRTSFGVAGTLALVFILGAGCAGHREDVPPREPVAPATGQPFSFAVISDTHTGGTKHTGKAVYARILEMVNDLEPEFLVHCGDWIIGPTYDGAGQATADTFLAYTAMLDSSIAFYPVLGNHEGDHKDYTYARTFFPVFGDSGWYSFDHENAHFFIVENNSDAPDSTNFGYRFCKPNGGINTPGSPQRRWLDSDLAARDEKAKWTFGFGHRTYYGAEQYAGRKNVEVARSGADAFCRVIEDAGVDIFWSGDQHCYTRTTPIYDGQAWSETDSSTVYLTVGGGGGRIKRGTRENRPFPMPGGVPEEAYVLGTREHHFFVHCTIDGALFHADVIDTSGALIDSFSIRKSP